MVVKCLIHSLTLLHTIHTYKKWKNVRPRETEIQYENRKNYSVNQTSRTSKTTIEHPVKMNQDTQ